MEPSTEPTTEPPRYEEDDEDERTTTTPPTTTPPTTTVPETTAPLPTEPIIYRGVEIPREILDQYDGYTLDELYEMGVLGAYFENVPLGLLPATNDGTLIWMLISILSALGLAGTTMIERKKRK